MKPIVDPEGLEVNHFVTACQPQGKKILEIGCGHGSLTYQYAELADKVSGIDRVYSELVLAKDNQPASRKPISFLCAKAETLPFPAQYFDIVLFASSL